MKKQINHTDSEYSKHLVYVFMNCSLSNSIDKDDKKSCDRCDRREVCLAMFEALIDWGERKWKKTMKISKLRKKGYTFKEIAFMYGMSLKSVSIMADKIKWLKTPME